MSSVRTVLAFLTVLCALAATRLCAETVAEKYEAAKTRCEATLKAGNIAAAFDALYALRVPASAVTNPGRHNMPGATMADWQGVLSDLVRLYTELAQLCERNKQPEQAERAYVKGMGEVDQLAPRIVVTAMSRGQDITGPDPTYAHPLRMSLADFYFRTNQLPRARAVLTKEISNSATSSGDVETNLKLALIEARTGRPDNAAKRLNDLEKHGGLPRGTITRQSDAELHVVLGDLYLELRRIAEARTHYAFAVDSGKLSEDRQKEVQTKLTNLGGVPKK